jgi:hypothetical protein
MNTLTEPWEDAPFSLPINPAADRKLDRAFRADRPTKTLGCIVPGCAQKFRPSTNYEDFLTHYKAKHGVKS